MSDSLYRKYRPKTFDDVVGQDAIVRTLRNAVDTNQFSHAYLFTGPRGTGKTTSARIFAKCLMCEKGISGSPDGTCESCELIGKGQHPDVAELDAASRTGVDNVRDEIISKIGFAPSLGKYKIYIIDEVHMLSTAAFNALLKTLEEPPAHVVFILCTTDPQKVPDTILSRCQRFDFKTISVEQLTARLGAVCEMEKVPFEGEALDLIARRSNGGMRDALTTLEQVITYGQGKVTLSIATDLLGKVDLNETGELIGAIIDRDVTSSFEIIDKLIEDGIDLTQYVQDLTQAFRNMYILKLSNCDIPLPISDQEKNELITFGKKINNARNEFMLRILGDCISDIRASLNPRLVFELAVFKIIDEKCEVNLDSLNARVSTLEDKMNNVSSQKNNLMLSIDSSEKSQDYSKDIKDIKVEKSIQFQHESGLEQKSEFGQLIGKPEEVPFLNSKPINVDNYQIPKSDTNSKQVENKQIEDSIRKDTYPINQDHIAASKKNDFDLIWKNLLREMQVDYPTIGCLLLNANPIFDFEKNELILEYGPENSFTYGSISKPAAKSAIIRTLEKLGYSGITIVVTKTGDNNLLREDTSSSGEESKNMLDTKVSETSNIDKQLDNDIDTLNEILAGSFGDNAIFKEIN